MSNLTIRICFCLVVMFAVINQNGYSQKIKKNITTAERRYQQGLYPSAYRYNTKNIGKLKTAEYLRQDKANIYLNHATIAEAMYKYTEMEQNLQLGLEELKGIPADSTALQIIGWEKASFACFQSGNFLLAEDYIQKAISFCGGKSEFSVQKKDLELQLAKILNERGFYNNALAIVNIQEEYRISRYEKREDNNGKSQSKKEVKKRKKEYGDLINLRTDVLLRKGQYTSLDSALIKNETWIKDNIGTRSFQYRDVLIIKARREETRQNTKQATALYAEASKYNKFSQVEKNSAALQEKLIYLYHERNKERESVKNRVKFQRAAQRFYGKNSLHYAKYKFQEVNLLYADYKYDKAEKKLNNIYKLKTSFPKNHQFTYELADMKAKLALKRSNFETAEDSLKRNADVKLRLLGENSPEYHKELLKLADFYSNYTNNFTLARQIQEKSFTEYLKPQISQQNLSYSRYMQQMANTYDLLEKYDLAVKYLEEASSNVKTYYGRDNIEYATDLEKLASVLLKKGEYVKAEELIKQAVDIFKKSSSKSNTLDKSAVYLTLAKLYNTLGMYNDAEDALYKASKFSRRGKRISNLTSAKSSDELAALYIKQGRYNEAEDILTYTLLMKEKKMGGNNRELIPTLNLFGELYIITGNYAAAEKSIRRTVALTSKVFGENTSKYAEALILLEKLYQELGDFKKAEETAKLVLSIQKTQLGNNHIEVAASLTRLAMIKLFTGGEAKESEKLLNDALGIVKFNLGDKNPLYAEQLKYLAYLYLETQDLDKAESTLDAADMIWVEKLGRRNINSADIAYLKGNIYTARAKYASAAIKYYEARDIYADLFSNKHPSYVKATSKLARSYFISKDYPRATKLLDEATSNYLEFTRKYFPSLSFSEKAKFWNQIKEDFEFYNTLALVTKDKNPQVTATIYNNILATKALLLSSSIKVKDRILNSKDETLINKYNDWTSKKQFLVTSLSLSKEAQNQAGIDLGRIEREIEILEKDLSESSELFANSFEKKNVTWKDISKSLKDNEYAIEILRFRYFGRKFTDSVIYAALVISNKTSKNPDLVLVPNGKQLESRYLKYYKNAVIIKAEEDDYSYEAFWKPIKNIIPDNATVYISAEGVYNEINLESLRAADGSFAIDKNAFVTITNTKDILQRSKDTKNNKLSASSVTLFGNPTFYASAKTNAAAGADKERNVNTGDLYKSMGVIKQLPGTEAEVNEINNLFVSNGWKVKKYVQVGADEDSIKQMRSPRILHIATHGYFNPDIALSEEVLSSTESDFAQNPLLRSGLLMRGAGDILKSSNSLRINSDNGVLTAYEAMDLNLDNTQLVVLSACETGKGEVQIGEGVFGLQRSIIVAGANTLVMTLFKVDDEITKELMVYFYKKWLETGALRTSFTDAKKYIKAKYKHPVYWGSFVMVGVE